jgi:hypothetical protein
MQVVIEPKVLGAIEFSVCVLQTASGDVVSLPPTTLEVVDYVDDIEDSERTLAIRTAQQQMGYFESPSLWDDESAATVFTSNRKFSPNSEVRSHTPPKLPSRMVQVGSTAALSFSVRPPRPMRRSATFRSPHSDIFLDRSVSSGTFQYLQGLFRSLSPMRCII